MENVQLSGITRSRNVPSRIWYLQPNLILSGAAPFLPASEDGKTPALRLLRLCLEKEQTYPPPTESPTIFLLPELSIHPSEVDEVRRELRKLHNNTLVVCGLGHMDEESARRIEDAPLWHGSSDGRYTNCALVCVGASGEVFLQPKIVPSRFELDHHWRGDAIRLFEGNGISFAVVVCSELLDRPLHETTLKTFLEATAKANKRLSLVFWIQHNQRPRSSEFQESFTSLRQYEPSATVLVAGSRPKRPQRYENYGCSGAVVGTDYFGEYFRFLAWRYHYVEPFGPDTYLSRIVLLRYDCDVVFVETVFADAIDPHSNTAKSLFEDVKPYTKVGDALVTDDDDPHIDDLLAPAAERGARTQGVGADSVERVIEKLTLLRTSGLLSFLDVALWPSPADGGSHHFAGQKHPGGDGHCRCWRHRVCIDRLTIDEELQEWLADVIAAFASLEQHGCGPTPTPMAAPLANSQLELGGQKLDVAVIHPCGRDGHLGNVLFGNNGRRLFVHPRRCIILGADARSLRPRVQSVDASHLRPTGGSDAGSAQTPLAAVVYQTEFWEAHSRGKVEELLRERFLQQS